MKWHCYFCNKSLDHTSKLAHLKSFTHEKNTSFLKPQSISETELDLLIQTMGIDSYEIYKQYGNRVNRMVRELKKRLDV